MVQDPRTPRGGLVTDRRTLAKAGAAGVALAAGSPAFADARSLALYKAIYDSGHAEGRAFAAQMARHGVAATAITGDITALWYDDLYHRWKDGPAPIAGLTDPRALFCLETLAHDIRMRVVFRSEYRPGPAGTMEHRAQGPRPLVETAAMLGPDGWGAGMARLVSTCAIAPARAPGTATARACEAPSPAAEALVAWVIAPVRRA